MQKVLVLGAGRVASPLVRDLLDHDLDVTVTSLDVSGAEQMIAGHPHGHPLFLDLDDAETISSLVAAADLVVSLLPFTFHPRVAKLCLEHRRHLVTASYVSPEMAAMDAEARDKDLLFLNEIGLDPGIDHMSAMSVIDGVRETGGEVVHFRSYCGGLVAPESNDNPFGYKFSWAPRGVLLASRNSASYREDGHIVRVPGSELFRDIHLVRVAGAGDFEAYPNRDSLEYESIYGLGGGLQTLFRGTLRSVGWCDTMHNFGCLGLLSSESRPAKGLTCAEYLAELVEAKPGEDLRGAVAQRLGIPVDSLPLHNLAWLGMTSDRPVGHDAVSPLDLLGDIMLEKLVFGPDERDMVVLFHDFKVRYPEQDRYERITSTLITCGEVGGDSAMSRTVSLPAAGAVRLILAGRVPQRGVARPVHPEIYRPILDELAGSGIECREESTSLETLSERKASDGCQEKAKQTDE